MASVPSNQLTEAHARLSAGETYIRFGRAWELESFDRPHEGRMERVVTLRHYGTTVLRVWGARPSYVCMQSASDRDGINGLLALMGIGGRYRAYFNHDLAMFEDRAYRERWEISSGTFMEI